jgi:hypothetical protein
MSETPTPKRPRGRPAQHLDAAARQAAYRERQETEAAEGFIALRLTEKPTLAFVELMIDRLLTQATDPDALRRALRVRLEATPKEG